MPQSGTSVAIAPWNCDTVAFLVVIRRQQWRTALTHDPHAVCAGRGNPRQVRAGRMAKSGTR